MKVSHSIMLILSGLVWLVVGMILLPLGLKFLIVETDHTPLLNWLAPFTGNTQNAALMVVALSLGVGYLKGKMVLGKSVNRAVQRIKSLPNPAPLAKMYTPAYILLLLVMVGLGIMVKWLPNDIRGAIDVAVGAALINGAVLYCRQAFSLQCRAVNQSQCKGQKGH